MFNSFEKIIYFALFLLFLIVRKYFTAKYRKSDYKKGKIKVLDTILLLLNGIGMIIPLIYSFSEILDFANYNRPFCMSIFGIIILIIAIICLWFSHYNLGSNWTPTLGIKKDHRLVKNGIYKYIRHPMYSAHIIWALGQMALLPNWIAGFSFILFSILLPLLRIKDEEHMMIEQFGERYKRYMKESGIIFPRLKFNK
ncbi:MAG: isoprenylcysteine carboxylmethyltransferase family protein [Bacteroidales bacterium]|nr:isoprenylcysteine carboxylmethyltransferase family protein [Bacteroidales bacterium]